MAQALYKAPTVNFEATSLNGSIGDSVQTITVNDASNLQSPGYIVINREDGNGNATPNAREVVKYTGITGSDLTGCTRAADGSTARAHADGSLVEPVLTIGMWNDQQDFLAVSLSTVDGSLRPLANASIVKVDSTNIISTNATISTLTVINEPAGVGGQFMWTRSGSLATVQAATATDYHFPLMRVSKNLTANSMYISLLSAPSLAAFQADVSLGSSPTGDFASIFSTVPTIDIGEYDTSTAATASVLGTTSLASGALLRFEIDSHGNAAGMGATLQVESR